MDLSGQSPIVARQVHVTIQHAGHESGGASLLVYDAGLEEPGGLWVSVLPLDPEEVVNDSPNWVGYADQDLSEYCLSDCERSYVIIGRLRDPSGPAISTGITVGLRSFYGGEGAAAPEGAHVSLTLDDEPAIVGGGATARLVVSDVIEVSNAQPTTTWRGRLSVPQELLHGYSVLGYPILGRLALSGVAAETGEGPSAIVDVEVGVAPAGFVSPSAEYPEPPLEVDWLSSCQVGADCNIPVTLTMHWDPISDESGRFQPGSVRFDFELDFRLEYLDRSDVPAGAFMQFQVE